MMKRNIKQIYISTVYLESFHFSYPRKCEEYNSFSLDEFVVIDFIVIQNDNKRKLVVFEFFILCLTKILGMVKTKST